MSQYTALQGKCFRLFDQAINFIVMKLGLVDISLSIFNKNSIQFLGRTNGKYGKHKIKLVAIGYKRGRFTILVNELSCAYISMEEFAFLLLHETLHYILKHPFLGYTMRHQEAKDIACDVIVNDILKIVFNKVLGDNGWDNIKDKFEHSYYYGVNTMGYPCHDKSIKEIYTILIGALSKDEETLKAGDHNVARGSHGIQQDSWEQNISQQQFEKDIQKLANVISSVFDNKENSEANEQEKIAGSGYGRTTIHVFNTMLQRFAFNKIFHKLIGESALRGSASSKSTKTWSRYLKSRVALSSKDGIMPSFVRHADKRKKINLYLDISGSIDVKQLQLFVRFIQNLPKRKYELIACTFTSVVEEITMEQIVKGLKVGGGTSFNAVRIHTAAQIKKPDNIIIITDGYSHIDKDAIDIEDQKKWRWIIDGSDYLISRLTDKLPGQIFRMADLTRR